MEDGVNMATGRNVQLSVLEATRPEPEPAPTHNLLTEVQTVREMLMRIKRVILTLASQV